MNSSLEGRIVATSLSTNRERIILDRVAHTPLNWIWLSMHATELRALQAPFKNQYRDDPASALVTLRAVGRLDVDSITCQLAMPPHPACAGLHPLTGGDGRGACSAEMLLQALVGCAGVTLGAVATAMEISVRSGSITVEGDVDFRGTLGISREVPIGFQEIRLKFDLDSDAPPDKLNKLIELTERYCVVYQTLKNSPRLVQVAADS